MTESNELAKPVDVLEEVNKSKTGTIAVIVIVALLLIATIVGLVVLAQKGNAEVAAQVRDVFIILLALEMFVIGVAVIVLVVQLANLTNLLQNEIKPILTSTTDTVNTLKGTVRFLSDNVTEPVIKMNESLASVRKLVDLFKFKK